MAFKFNRILGWIFLLALLYGSCQTFGLLPEWAPKPFPKRVGPLAG